MPYLVINEIDGARHVHAIAESWAEALRIVGAEAGVDDTVVATTDGASLCTVDGLEVPFRFLRFAGV